MTRLTAAAGFGLLAILGAAGGPARADSRAAASIQARQTHYKEIGKSTKALADGL